MGIFSRVKKLFSREKDEPIHAIVLLRSSPKFLDTETLESVVSRALGVDFSNKDENDPNASFVVGFPPMLTVKLPEAFLLVNCMPAPYVDKPEKIAKQITDLRLRKAVSEHTAWLSVDWMGDRDEESLGKGYPILGKIAAELIDDECVALYSTSTNQLIPVHEDVLEGLRGENPLELFDHMVLPPVVNISGEDPRMKASVEEARSRWPEFVEAFQRGDAAHYSVKAPVSDGKNTEYIWIEVKEIDGDNIAGDLANDPVDLQFMKLGSRVRTTLDQLNDWAYINDDELIGGFTVKVLQEAQGRR